VCSNKNKGASGDSLVLHCASPLRTILAPLARADTKGKGFPQTKLDNEINALLLLKEHCDHHFLFRSFNEENILNN